MDENTASETATIPLTFVEVNPPPASPEKKENFPVTVEDIRSRENSTIAIIHHVVQAMDEGQSVPVEIIQALFSRYFENEYQSTLKMAQSPNAVHYNEDYQRITTEQFLALIPKVPWPQNSTPAAVPKELEPIPKYLDTTEIENKIPGFFYDAPDFDVCPSTSKIFYELGLADTEYRDSLLELAQAAFNLTQKQEDKAAVAQWLLHLSGNWDDDEFFWPVVNQAVFSQVEEKLLAQTVIDFLIQNPDQYHFSTEGFTLESGWTPGEEKSLLYEYTSKALSETLICLSAREDDDIKKVLGVLIDAASFPRLVEKIRDEIKDDQNSPKAKAKLERVGRVLFGFNPDDTSIPFHASLESFYHAFCIGEYHTNEAVNQYEVDLITKLLEKSEVKDGYVVDNACGTGRIANALSQSGVRNIVGIDITPEYIQSAKNQDQTKTVNYHEGSWEKTQLPGQSVRLMALVGRSIHHASGGHEMLEIFKEAHRVLKEDGVFLIDFANSDKGLYLQNRIKFLSILKDINFPLEKLGANQEEQLAKIDRVVDSPDGINFCNRYTPKEESVIAALRLAGFEDIQIIRTPIEGWEGAENMYFTARKSL